VFSIKLIIEFGCGQIRKGSNFQVEIMWMELYILDL
jgi:hypothetical protein